ncbi:uncharacterized protein [Dermacentor albipictus]|uniref:uncharacterized protein n=1 Tax=Dermacentor albipictus TaxID=60249 RepID=UPI0038FCAF2F
MLQWRRGWDDTHAVKVEPDAKYPQTAVPLTTMASHMLPNFDDAADKWKPYLIKVEAYFEANAISDSTKKRALLVAALSTSTIQILMGRIAPAKPNALSYDEVVRVLNDHYDPKRNEIAESFQFFNRCQQENESIHDFFVAIRRIADNCNFGDSLSRLLRDRIVCGVRSKAVQKQLLSKKELTLEEAESIAIAAETAEKDARTMSVDVPPVLKVEAHRKLPSRSSTESAGRLECGRCGSFRHDSNSCRWAKALCYSCGQRGHLAKMCHSRNGNGVPSNRRVHHAKALAVEDAVSEEDNSDSAHIWTLASARKNALQPPIRRTFSWGGVDLSMEVDTGSPVCVISRQLFDKHHKCWPSLQPSHVKLSCYNGRLPVVGELQLCVKYRDISVNCALVVLDCPGPSLCGRDLLMLLEQAGVPVLQVTGEGEATADQVDCHRIHAICDTYQDVFSETLGLIKGPPASLLLKGDAVPKFCKARPIPYALRDKVSQELDRLVSLGVISPVKHSNWATPIVPVLKKDGSVRICGDFKATLNPACATEQYPLPVIQDIFASLGGGQLFSTLDLRDAYNQVLLDEDSRKLCVINTHKGLFCYNRLPFGISSAPAIFQRKLDTILSGLPGVQAYLDDVLVAEGVEDCGARLQIVLERFREHGVKLRYDKCKFSQPSVAYLGHRIDRTGLHPTEKNVDAIMNAPSPQNLSELRSFLGMISFYSKFLPNMSDTLFPLYQLLEKNARWQWKLSQESAFRKAKQHLKDAEVLVHFDPSRKLKLECDASARGIGAVLFHTIGSTNRPVGFRSRTLTKAERNYPQLEREALALVFGVTKFRDYLLGREFVLVSDHQPLLGLLRPDRQTPAMAAARIQRWALYLGGYRYKLEYAPGRLLLNADALSRLPLQGSDLVTEPDPEERTPQKTGKSPSEMLLGYQIRSRLDTCFPAATVSNSKKENDEWLPPTDCSVHVRNYGSNGKWIPGRVTATSGGRMITVETPQAIVRRHIDQVRTRTESSPDEPPGTDPGLISRDRTQSAPPLCQEPSASPEDAGESSPQEAFRDLDHQIPVPPLVASGAGQVPMQPVRRSTRSRKPVQRF